MMTYIRKVPITRLSTWSVITRLSSAVAELDRQLDTAEDATAPPHVRAVAFEHFEFLCAAVDAELAQATGGLSVLRSRTREAQDALASLCAVRAAFHERAGARRGVAGAFASALRASSGPVGVGLRPALSLLRGNDRQRRGTP